jgi:proliferating cell nuclear antigen
MENLDEYSLLVKTISTTTIKTLFEVLKEVLTRNVNLIFDDEGVKITDMDNTKKVLVNLRLNAESFQMYHCAEKMILGIITSNIFKIIRIVTNNDTFTFAIRKDNPEYLLIRLQDIDKNKIFESSVRLLDLKYKEFQIPDSTFDTEISMVATEFQNIIKNINSLGGSEENMLEISSVEDKLVFKYKGEFSQQKIVFSKSDSTIISQNDNNTKDSKVNIIQGNYNIKFLLLFAKATKLSQYMNLYMKNNYPIVIEYYVGNLGFLRFILAQN